MCSYQGVNYTIVIEEVVDNEAVNSLVNGPYYHQGPDIASHKIRGLKNDHTYLARVQLNNITGVTESVKYFFGKLITKPNQVACECRVQVMMLIIIIITEQVLLPTQMLLN